MKDRPRASRNRYRAKKRRLRVVPPAPLVQPARLPVTVACTRVHSAARRSWRPARRAMWTSDSTVTRTNNAQMTYSAILT